MTTTFKMNYLQRQCTFFHACGNIFLPGGSTQQCVHVLQEATTQGPLQVRHSFWQLRMLLKRCLFCVMSPLCALHTTLHLQYINTHHMVISCERDTQVQPGEPAITSGINILPGILTIHCLKCTTNFQIVHLLW